MAPKNCTECKKCTTCKSWYGGCGCTEAPMTIFGPNKAKDAKEVQVVYHACGMHFSVCSD